MNEDNGSRYIQPHDSLEAMELIQKLFNQYRRAPLTPELLAYHQDLIERLEGDIHQAAEAEGQTKRVQELDRMIKLMKDWTAIRLSGRPFNAKMRHFRFLPEGGQVKFKRHPHKIKASSSHRASRH